MGDDAGAATGAGVGAPIDEDDVLFWDFGGAWVAPPPTEDGKTPPRQRMMAIEFVKNL